MKQRIISAIVAILICVPIVIAGGDLFCLGVGILGLIGVYELFKTRSKNRDIPYLMKAIIMLLFIFIMMDNILDDVLFLSLSEKYAISILFTLLPTIFYNKSGKYNIEDALFYLGSIFFLGCGFNTLINTRMDNLYLFIYLIFITIFTDTFAYFTGYFIGKNKMCKSVSPNKTWEGFIGGLVMGTFISSVFYMSAFPNEVSLISVIVVTLILSVIGQLGDLLFSVIKRHYGIKDFGNIMPGHGGVLDRLDSILVVMIAFSYLARFL